MSEVHKIKFPIGDWSDDGHGKCDWYIVQSNKPLKDLMEAHMKFKTVVGFDIGSMCGEYEENSLTSEASKFVLDNKFLNVEVDEFQVDELSDKIFIGDTEVLLKVWLGCLKYIDPELQLTIEEDDLPQMCSWSYTYAFKDSKAYLRTPGYGLFV